MATLFEAAEYLGTTVEHVDHLLRRNILTLTVEDGMVVIDQQRLAEYHRDTTILREAFRHQHSIRERAIQDIADELEKDE